MKKHQEEGQPNGLPAYGPGPCLAVPGSGSETLDAASVANEEQVSGLCPPAAFLT